MAVVPEEVKLEVVEEEVKQATDLRSKVVEEKKSLMTVANVKWDYFSPENSNKVSVQKPIDKKAKMMEKINRTNASIRAMNKATEDIITTTTLNSEEDVMAVAL